MLFDSQQNLVYNFQAQFSDETPQPGWVEHSPQILLTSVVECIEKCLKEYQINPSSIVSIGITNQRETTVVWDSETGEPLYNAIVWLDSRTSSTCEKVIKELKQIYGDKDSEKDYVNHFRSRTGLPLATYFSAVKLKWLYDNIEKVRNAIDNNRCRFGTVDSWLIYKLTGHKVHITDVTNASRTLMMNLKTLQWDPSTIEDLGLPVKLILNCLPEIKSSAEIYGSLDCSLLPDLKGLPIAGCLGDQQSALLGQRCVSPGLAKNTYGTGCFMLMNTGNKVVESNHGLLSTVAFKLGPNAQPFYALEGSIAIAGRAVQWLRDNLGLIKSSSEIEELAKKVSNTGGVFFVTALSGLFAPHWRPDARGIIVGLTQYTTKEHIALATLQAAAFQTREVLDAMKQDSQVDIKKLLVDGGMSTSDTMLQFQSDILGISVFRPSNLETTALGAALAAGLASGFYSQDSLDHSSECTPGETFNPSNLTPNERETQFTKWKDAVQRSFNLS